MCLFRVKRDCICQGVGGGVAGSEQTQKASENVFYLGMERIFLRCSLGTCVKNDEFSATSANTRSFATPMQTTVVSPSLKPPFLLLHFSQTSLSFLFCLLRNQNHRMYPPGPAYPGAVFLRTEKVTHLPSKHVMLGGPSCASRTKLSPCNTERVPLKKLC